MIDLSHATYLIHTCYMTLCFYYVIKDVGYLNLVVLAQDMLQKQASVILSTHYFQCNNV